MSDPIDDKALDEYLQRRSGLSQRYRELGDDEVPPALDRRVLDQARAAVAKQASARSRAWLRWSTPLALAASAVLVLAIVIESGVQRELVPAAPAPTEPLTTRMIEEESAGQAGQESAAALDDSSRPRNVLTTPVESKAEVRSTSGVVHDKRAAEVVAGETAVTSLARRSQEKSQEAPAAAAVREELARAPQAPMMEASPAGSVEPAEPKVEHPTATIAPTQASPPPPATGSVQPSRNLEEVIAVQATSAPGSTRNAGPRRTVPAESFEHDTGSAVQESPVQKYSDPQRWLEDIRQLRKDGKSREADREWERFRAAFPEHPVADDDPALAEP